MNRYIKKLEQAVSVEDYFENPSRFMRFASFIAEKKEKGIQSLWLIGEKTEDNGIQLLLRSSVPAHTVERTLLNGWIADNLGPDVEIIYDYDSDFLSDGNLVKGTQSYLKEMLDEKQLFSIYSVGV